MSEETVSPVNGNLATNFHKPTCQWSGASQTTRYSRPDALFHPSLCRREQQPLVHGPLPKHLDTLHSDAMGRSHRSGRSDLSSKVTRYCQTPRKTSYRNDNA